VPPSACNKFILVIYNTQNSVPLTGKSKPYLEGHARKVVRLPELVPKQNNYVTELTYEPETHQLRRNVNTLTQMAPIFKYSPPSKHDTTNLIVPSDSLKAQREIFRRCDIH